MFGGDKTKPFDEDIFSVPQKVPDQQPADKLVHEKQTADKQVPDTMGSG